jgi:hypothetical protein
MEFEFDKEIDALLRQPAKAENAFAENDSQSAIRISHLDADAISAFAGNALPEKTKNHYTKHFADCERCRKILSNVIASNSETVYVEETKKVAAVAIVPWYRKLFVYPNLAYTLGALVLAFSGLVAFVVLQNDSRNAQVSQVAERQPAGKGMSSDGDAIAPETNFSDSSSFNSASAGNSGSVYSQNSATMNAPAKSAMRNFNSSAVSGKPSVSPTRTPKEEPRREENSAKNKTALPENNFAVDGAVNEKQERAREKKEDKKDAENNDAISPAAALTARQQSELPSAGAQPGALAHAPPRKARSVAAGETTKVGGKTFKRANGVWIDSSYKGQATTNISRGTNEYKKLDAGLRSIAESLNGAVIVVWKEKAYRIQ